MVEVQLIFEPEHWNENCGCVIPAAWTAFIVIDDEPEPKWPCGDSLEEAERNVLREFPNAVILS